MNKNTVIYRFNFFGKSSLNFIIYGLIVLILLLFLGFLFGPKLDHRPIQYGGKDSLLDERVKLNTVDKVLGFDDFTIGNTYIGKDTGVKLIYEGNGLFYPYPKKDGAIALDEHAIMKDFGTKLENVFGVAYLFGNKIYVLNKNGSIEKIFQIGR